MRKCVQKSQGVCAKPVCVYFDVIDIIVTHMNEFTTGYAIQVFFKTVSGKPY